MWKRKRNNILAQNTKRTHHQPEHTCLREFLCFFAGKQCHKIRVVSISQGQKSWMPPSQWKKKPHNFSMFVRSHANLILVRAHSHHTEPKNLKIILWILTNHLLQMEDPPLLFFTVPKPTQPSQFHHDTEHNNTQDHETHMAVYLFSLYEKNIFSLGAD